MRLRAWKLFFLSLSFAIAAAQPPALAQSPGDGELAALKGRGFALYQSGKYGDAIRLAKQYAEGTKARYGENAPEYAEALTYLAELFRLTNGLTDVDPLAPAQSPSEAELAALKARGFALYQAGQYRATIPLAEQYAEGTKTRYGENAPEYAESLTYLAELFRLTNRLAEAEPLMRRALAIDEKTFGPDHPNVGRDVNNLATVLQATNRLADAEPFFRRALAIDEKTFGRDHPNVAMHLNNLASLLQETNRLTEAEPLMRRVIAILEKSLGPNHPNLAVALNSLASLLQETNRFTESEPLIRRALSIDEKSFGPDHPNVGRDLNNLALLLKATNRRGETEPLFRRALSIDEKSFGPDHPNLAVALNSLASLLQETNRLAEAEPLIRRALSIDEKSFGPDHPNVAMRLNTLAQLLQATNRFTESEPLIRRALSIDETSCGPDHPNVGRDLNNLAVLLEEGFGNYEESERLKRRALAIDEKSLGPNHPSVGIRLNNLATLLQATNRLADAEPLFRRALSIDEASFGPDHPSVGRDLNNLALLLQVTNRLSEAEPLIRRALSIDEKSFGPDHPNVSIRLHNLAALLKDTNRLAEAEPLIRRALSIDEKSFGPDHPNVAMRLNALAQLLQATNRFTEAEPLIRRALSIDEKSFGPDHPNVGRDLNNLAVLLEAANRLAEAEPLMRRALNIDEASFGSDHPNVGIHLNNLAHFLADQGQWSAAVVLYSRAKPIMIGARRVRELERGSLGKAVLTQNTGNLRAYTRALFRADASAAANLAEGFELAQWALQNEAAVALSSMAVRFAKGAPKLAKLVREQQDLIANREAAYRNLDTATGRADAKAAEIARAAIIEIEAKLAGKEAQLAKDFPNYAALANPKPLLLKEAQALLGEHQALVLFLDLWQMGKIPEETIVFALTKQEARWISLYPGTSLLQRRVASLRCGLDRSNWRVGDNSRETCKTLLGAEAAEDQLPPFDAEAAHALYLDLFGGVEDLIKDKSLLIVPSGALTQLPFEALVTEKPDGTLPRFDAYRKAAWLGQRQAISILPSVGSLKALGTHPSAAAAPFIGFGNPLLDGQDGKDKRAWGKQSCPKFPTPKHTRVASRAAGLASVFRNGQPSVEALRHQPPLPETADELCEIAHSLWIPESGLDSAVYLGEHATVSQVKALSKSGELARARAVHFATHGLLAGQTALFAKNKAEPALVLTPPAASSEEDNGLLTASEVAQLNLNADWVVMSACNTAAGSSEGAEALSGLARAFFYAGARSLLVSHWEVNSEAAVAITTGAVNAMKAEPSIGRAEALRRSIAALIAKGGENAHPSVWAPFVLVGNGEQ